MPTSIRTSRDGSRQLRASASLGDREYLIDAYTVADITNSVVANFARGLGAPIPESLPRLQAWFDRIAARPAVADDLALQRHALKTRIG